MSDEDRLEIFQDKRGRWRWRRFDASGAVVGATTEGFPTRALCEANARRGVNPADRWEFYLDRRGLHRWRRLAPDGRMIAAASRGFPSRPEAEANARRQGFRA